MSMVSGYVQQAILRVLLEHGVGGVSSIAQHANTTTASIFHALNRLLEEELIAIAPLDFQDENSRKGARQYGLTPAGIDAAIALDGATA